VARFEEKPCLRDRLFAEQTVARFEEPMKQGGSRGHYGHQAFLWMHRTEDLEDLRNFANTHLLGQL
jgi:hypothetical protein